MAKEKVKNYQHFKKEILSRAINGTLCSDCLARTNECVQHPNLSSKEQDIFCLNQWIKWSDEIFEKVVK